MKDGGEIDLAVKSQVIMAYCSCRAVDSMIDSKGFATYAARCN